MIVLSDHAEGTVIPIRVQPRARKVGIGGEQGGALKVAVSAPPEDGKANREVLERLAEALGLRRPQLEMVSGLTSRMKKVLIRGVSRADLERLLTIQLAQH